MTSAHSLPPAPQPKRWGLAIIDSPKRTFWRRVYDFFRGIP